MTGCAADGELYVEANNVVELRNLTNNVTGLADTAATVTLRTLTDRNGAQVGGQVFPAAMTHDTGGTYRTTLDAALEITAGQRYTAEVHAIGSGGEEKLWCPVYTAVKPRDE